MQVAPSPYATGRAAPPPRQDDESDGYGRVVTRQPANIRGWPGMSSPVVRVTSSGMVLRVFGQQGAWVQVGDSVPWGWVHSAVVERSP